MIQRNRGRRCCLVLALGWFVNWGGVQAQSSVAEPAPEATQERDSTSAIQDQAELFPRELVRRLTDQLRLSEAKTGVPIVVETVDSLGGKPVNDAALERAKSSGGRGVYLLISKRDKAISRLFVTKEFAERFPEPRRQAIQDALIDAFRRGRYEQGITTACGAIVEAITGEKPTELPASTATQDPRESPPSSPLIRRGGIDLTLGGAAQVIEGAKLKAQEMNLHVNIAVVDDGGHLIAFARMDGARPASGYTAITKATTAATFRQATGPLPRDGSPPDVWLNLSLQLTASASGGKVTTLYGGVPVEVDGQIIGAVGVGGGTGEQDAEVARAGIQSFLDALGMPEPSAR